MSSRRVMQRSYSGDGRSGLHNADDVNGSSRPASRSYLSNVRPESSCSSHRYSQYRPPRSTLCSVMAQLTEETQPTFELTLRSKAVSEECKVAFTCQVRGHPIPEVIWYKDDVQLDRYCGRPKYEIFRNGPNHSLHIYNCTLEDAAIYQASASNTKGIVSCSGVLEVGLMNEYLIHQRYFAKLKQKADNRRRELEGHENPGVAEQDPLRNLSPDRSLRKRRSTMAPHFSAPGCMETVSTTAAEHRQVPEPGAEAEAEARLQDPTARETVVKPGLVANGTSAGPAVNGHTAVPEDGGKGNTYVYDSVQKVFTAHQPQNPIVKKKIKISNSEERVSEERSSNARACETQAPTELVNTQRPFKEVMEVESSLTSAPLDSAPPANTEPGQKRPTERVLNVDKTPSKKDKISLGRASDRLQGTEIATQKEKPIPSTGPVNVSPAGTLHKHHAVDGTGSKQDELVLEERVGHGETKKTNLDSRSPNSPQVSPAQRQPAHIAAPQQPFSSNQKQKGVEGGGATAVDAAIGPTATEPETRSSAPKSRTTVNVDTSLPAVKRSDSSRPRRQGATVQGCLSEGDAGDTFLRTPGKPGSRKETNPRLENVSVSEPQQLAEVTQAHAQPNRTGAPVGLKPPAPRCLGAAPAPQRAPSEKDSVPAGGQEPAAHRPVCGATQTARDHSRGSSERNAVPFTGPATFPDEGLGHGQSGCSVSRAARRPGASAVQTEEGTDMPVERKAAGKQPGTTLAREERRALSQRKVEMEADVVAMKIERAQIGATLDESQKETVFITHAGVFPTEMDNESVFKSTVETHSILHETNISGVDNRNQHVTLKPRSVNVPDTNVSEQQINPLKEAHKPGHNVLSVAEMMRSQIKALDSTMSDPFTGESNSAMSSSAESVTSTPLFASSTKNEAAAEKCSDLREDLEKGHDMKRAFAIAVEDKIETNPPEQPPKPTPPTTEAIASSGIPPYRGEENAKLQDLERTIEIEQRVEAKTVPTPAVLDTTAKLFGFQQIISTTECTPEQPQTPIATTPEAITSLNRGEDFGKGVEVERTIEIEQKIEAKPVVLHTTAQEFGFQHKIHLTESIPEQPQIPTAPTTEAITSLTRGEDPGKDINVERTIEKEMEAKTDTKSASTPEVPDIMVTLLEFPPQIQTTQECASDPPLTPTAPTSEAIISFSIPPIAVSDTEGIADAGTTYSGMENYSIMDTGHECGASSPISLGDRPGATPAAAMDENTCCSNASLGEGERTVLTTSKSVIVTQESRKSLRSADTGIDPGELCCTEDSREISPSLEHHSPKHLQALTTEGFKQIPCLELKLNSETNLKSMPVLSTTCVDVQKTPELTRSRVETKHVANVFQQEKILCVIEPTMTAIAPPMSPSNDEAPPQEVKSDALTFSSATPKELASGARRKIFSPKSKTVEDNPTPQTAVDGQPQDEEVLPKPSKAPPGPATLSVPPGPSQQSSQSLLAVEPNGQRTPPVRRRSPLLSRKVVAQETPAAGKEALQQTQVPKGEEKATEKEKPNPFKAPQVIRKIRGESFSDASGHLKLWCQFFNVLSDSLVSWYRDDVEVAQVKRSAGDETPVNLAIIQASKKDCGVYGCKITNDHGTDITDLLLSAEILGGMRLREDLGVGEEIEMTPLLLNKGVADGGVWGSKFFGRVMVQESHIGGGCSRKTWRAKVVYGLEPVFESGTTCIIKMCNRITYGGKGEAQLTERNVEMERQKCRIQSLAREYCKIFSAESRVIDNFGPCLEVIPVYLMYRPANTVPYATVEADLKGVFLKYCKLSAGAGLVSRTGSEVELKCCALQHWIYQWTSGNLLLTQLEGVDNKLTNVGISVKSTGYQGLSAVGNPDLLEQFVSQHQCNYYCGLLGLRPLKTSDLLQMPSSKSRGSKSPLLQRKAAAGAHSPQTARRAGGSPRMPRKADGEQDKSKSPMKPKEVNTANTTS